MDFYAQVDLTAAGDNIVSIGSHNSDYVCRYFIAIAAGANYSKLNKIQCEISFQPKRFNVHVVKASSTITANAIDGTCPDPEPRGMLRSKVLDSMNRISMVATSLYSSTVGNALMENINSFQTRQSSNAVSNGPNLKNVSYNTILHAVSDSVIAMADDFLMSFAAAALTQPNTTSFTQVQAEFAAVRIGSTRYIIAIVIINVCATLVVTIASLRTRFWAQLPLFDYTDLACISAGLVAYATRPGPDKGKFSGVLKHWNGDPRDTAIGRMVVGLRVEPGSKELSVSLKPGL